MTVLAKARIAAACLMLTGCIASYPVSILNNSGSELVFSARVGETIVTNGARSEPVNIQYFGPGTEPWLELNAGNCNYSYVAPNVQNARKTAPSMNTARNVLVLEVDRNFVLHLVSESSSGDFDEITEFGFPLSPKVSCE